MGVDQFDKFEVVVVVDRVRGGIGRIVHHLAEPQHVGHPHVLGTAGDQNGVGAGEPSLEIVGLERQGVWPEGDRQRDRPTVVVGPSDVERSFAAGKANLADVDPAVSVDFHRVLIRVDRVATVGGDLKIDLGDRRLGLVAGLIGAVADRRGAILSGDP